MLSLNICGNAMNNWQKVKLGDICFMTSGGTPSRKNSLYYDGDIPWAKISDIENAIGGVIYKTEEYITHEALLSINNRVFEPGTLLLAMYGSVGKVAFTGIRMSTNQAILGIKILDESRLNYAYLKYWFTTIKENLLNRAVGGTLQNISLGIVKDLEIPLPPIKEQKRIADILDKADALRRKDAELIKKYDELAQSIFIDMFGDPVTNPKGWNVVEIDSICTDIVDCINRTAPIIDDITGYKMIRTSNVRNYKINLIDIRHVSEETFMIWNRRLAPSVGDIVFTREAPVGEAGIIESNDKFFLGQRTMLYRINDEIANNYFILFQIMGEFVQNQINRLGSGSTVKHLSVFDCKKFLIYLPPLKLQNLFCNKISNLSKQINVSNNLLSHSEQLFQSLLQLSFNGKLIHHGDTAKL